MSTTAPGTMATPSKAMLDGHAHKKKGKMKFFYDPETKTCLGRTGLSWFKILFFYVIFFSFLVAVGAVALHIILVYVPKDKPVFTGKAFGCAVAQSQSIGIRPKPPLTDYEKRHKWDHLRSTVLWIKEGSDDNSKFYVQDLSQIMSIEDKLNKCTDKPGCQVFGADDSEWGECKKPDNKDDPNAFGYKVGRPCVMVRLNRLFDWEPSKEEIQEYYKGKKRQKETYRSYLNWRDENKKFVEDGYKVDISKMDKFVWINCRGETVDDDANIGPIQYYPKPGIPISYFPFTGNVAKWASPYVMVQFQNVRRGVLINVRCEAYNNNIEPRTGVVKFGLLVDPK